MWIRNSLVYIYIYISTDCFVVSQLFSVARHVGRLKLGSKPAQIYARLSITLLGQQAYHVGKGIIKYYCCNSRSSVRLFTFYTLPDTRMLNSFEEFCIMRAAAANSFARILNPHGGAYILSSTDRLLRCITTLQCSYTRRTGRAGRVFANGPGNQGSIPGRVILKTQKMYLMPPCLTLSIIRYGSRIKWSNPAKGLEPSPTPWCCSWWKGNLQVTLDYGRQLYLLIWCKVSTLD